MDGGMNIRMRKKDWLILGGKLATRIVKDTDKGISQDKDGEKFKPYNKEYAIKNIIINHLTFPISKPKPLKK